MSDWQGRQRPGPDQAQRRNDLWAALAVAAGSTAAVTRRVIQQFAAPPRTGAAAATPWRPPGLTDRELAVLIQGARGTSNAEIARALGETTVKTHVSRVLAKLGLRDRTPAVVFAYEHGVVLPGG